METEQLFTDVACDSRREPHDLHLSVLEGELPKLIQRASDASPRATARQAKIVLARVGDQIDGQALWKADSNGVSIIARKATSCMLMPCPGDTVQVLVDGASAWIVAVLERGPEATCSKIDFGNDDVVVRAGSLALQGRRSITQEAAELHVTALVVREVTEERRSLVRQASIVHAGSMAVDVDRHLTVHSRLATISADALLKLDGAQIHMG